MVPTSRARAVESPAPPATYRLRLSADDLAQLLAAIDAALPYPFDERDKWDRAPKQREKYAALRALRHRLARPSDRGPRGYWRWRY